jgi:hypothetical protein
LKIALWQFETTNDRMSGLYLAPYEKNSRPAAWLC